MPSCGDYFSKRRLRESHTSQRLLVVFALTLTRALRRAERADERKYNPTYEQDGEEGFE